MKSGILLACAAAFAVSATTAFASITFDGSPGTSAPPSTLGGYTMTAFGDDARSNGGTVADAPGPNGDVSFSPSLSHTEIGVGWATWSNGYTGDVYSTGGTSVTISMPSNTLAFYFYAEPNSFSTFTISATSDDGTSSGPVSVNGFAGAKYFGFYATGGDKISSITVSVPSASAWGFAVGEFGIFQCSAPTISVALSSTLLWPPNHTYANISATVTTNGTCGGLTVELYSVTSNEPDDGVDDGNTVNDINGAAVGTEDYAFQLRAERSGVGTGRIYTVTYKVTDALGQTAYASATVLVPLNHSMKPALTMDEWNGTVLGQNQPNPVVTSTRIPFRLGQAGAVDVAVFDAAGAVVRTIHLGDLTAGDHFASWDGLDDAGARVPAGHYIYRLVGVECGCATAKGMNVVR